MEIVSAVKPEIRVRAKKTPRPKFSRYNGRTWDRITLRHGDADLVVHYDTTWGKRGYFEVNGEWWVVPIMDFPFSTRDEVILAGIGDRS